MDGKKYILSIDQGTTGSGAIVFNSEGKPIADADKETTQIYPQPGWVEHNPDEIFKTSLEVAALVHSKGGHPGLQTSPVLASQTRERPPLCGTGKPASLSSTPLSGSAGGPPKLSNN